MQDITISFLQHRDIPAAARLLSMAMLHNSLHVAVFGGQDETARQAIEKMFADLFIELPGISFLAKRGEQLVGVMRMKSCQGSKTQAPPARESTPDPVLTRKQRWHTLWALHDPAEPHWHLGPIGVDPVHQGKGIGNQLLTRFCKEVDVCKAPAYLETDLAINVRFYQNHGFDVVEQEDIFGLTNSFMWRPAIKTGRK